MKKVLLISFILFGSMFQAAMAERIPVKITPNETISTNHDEIEVGDWISFQVVNDVYVDDSIYIHQNSTIIGCVDFVQPNGWGGDSAEIKFNTFKTIDAGNKKITINYPLDIVGNCSKENDVKSFFANYVFTLIRGSEIYIEPDTKTFNIFITR